MNDDSFNEIPALRVVASAPMAFGGDQATTALDLDHQGAVSLAQEYEPDKVLAVFATFEEARKAAVYAIQPHLGGYGPVVLAAADAQSVSHGSWEEWALAFP
jgi:hypothetical protein